MSALGVQPCLISAMPAGLEVGAVSFVVNMRTPERSVAVALTWKGAMAERVRAARVVVHRAQDNLGVTLVQESAPLFYHETVGRIDGDGAMRSSKQPLSFRMSGAAMVTTALRLVEGTVEAIMPDKDPESVVTVTRITEHLGRPIVLPALARAGVKVTVFDRATKPTWMLGGIERKSNGRDCGRSRTPYHRDRVSGG